MHKKDEYFIIGISCNLSLVNNLVEKRHLRFLYTNHQKWRKKKKIQTSTMIIHHITLVYNHCYKHKKRL